MRQSTVTPICRLLTALTLGAFACSPLAGAAPTQSMLRVKAVAEADTGLEQSLTPSSGRFGVTTPSSAGLEESLTGQFLAALRELFNEPRLERVTVETLARLAKDFGGEQAGPTSEKFWDACHGSAEALVQRLLKASVPQPTKIPTPKTPVVVLAVTGALDFSVTWRPAEDRLLVDPAGVRCTLGGSPINVMVALASLGAQFEPVGTYGNGPRGALQRALMEQAGIPGTLGGHWVPLAHDTPFNVFPIVRDLGQEYRIIGAPPGWSLEEREAFIAQEHEACRNKAGGVFIVTSRPPGGDPEILGDLLAIGQQHQLVTLYNPKADVVSQPAMLDRILQHANLFTANLAELATMSRQDEAALRQDPQAIITQARHVMQAHPSVRIMLISLDQGGALWIERDRVAYAPAPKITVVNSVGAGDTALAALVARYARSREMRTGYSFETLSDRELAELLRAFVAAGTETARHEGTGGATLDEIAAMEQHVTADVYRDADLSQLHDAWSHRAGAEEPWTPESFLEAVKKFQDARPLEHQLHTWYGDAPQRPWFRTFLAVAESPEMWQRLSSEQKQALFGVVKERVPQLLREDPAGELRTRLREIYHATVASEEEPLDARVSALVGFARLAKDPDEAFAWIKTLWATVWARGDERPHVIRQLISASAYVGTRRALVWMDQFQKMLPSSNHAEELGSRVTHVMTPDPTSSTRFLRFDWDDTTWRLGTDGFLRRRNERPVPLWSRDNRIARRLVGLLAFDSEVLLEFSHHPRQWQRVAKELFDDSPLARAVTRAPAGLEEAVEATVFDELVPPVQIEMPWFDERLRWSLTVGDLA